MDPSHNVLNDLVVVLGTAAIVVVVFSRLRLPAIAGFVTAGIVAGPPGLGLVGETHAISLLAEVGVVLLLFSLGLEFNLERLRRLWRMVLLGGALQVLLTIAVAAGVARLFGMEWSHAVFAGFLVALSSTAIVLRALAERQEETTLHGRLITGILIFQDLCVVPMVLIVPLLAGKGGSWDAVGLVLGKAVLVVVGVLTLSRFVAPRTLGWVAASRSREAFMMTTVVTCLGIAWLTSMAGLSPALGAFLAGMVVADTEYGHQAMADVLPFRDTLVALFFVSVGMLLDTERFAAAPLLTLGLAGAILLGKAIIVTVAAAALRLPFKVAVTAGLALAQVGEFSFVLAQEGRKSGLVDEGFLAVALNASVVTMLITPLVVRLTPHVVLNLGVLGPLERLLGFRGIEEASPEQREAKGHLVIGGYGVGGRYLAAALLRRDIPFIVLELNPESVREGRRRGHPVWYGDSTQREVLEKVGLPSASGLVLLLSNVRATAEALRMAREIAPSIPVLARARFVGEADALARHGALAAVSEELEGSLGVIQRALEIAGLNEDRAREEVDLTREAEQRRRDQGLPPGTTSKEDSPVPQAER